MAKIKGKLKTVVKSTEKQLKYAPDLTGTIEIEGWDYNIGIFLTPGGGTIYLEQKIGFNNK